MLGSVSPRFCALQVIQVASLSNETLEVTNEELHKLRGDDICGRNKVGGESWAPLPGGEVAELAVQQGSIRRKKQNFTCGLQQFHAGNRTSPKKEGFASRKGLVLADLLW